MYKKRIILVAFAVMLVSLMTACGEKSEESVLKKMDKQLEEMKGYKTNAEMKMHTGKEEQVYQVEVWHKKNNLYRVALSNDSDEEKNQIILKNEEGVFVLTPSLEKSFKFQTEWPENSSQSYLYESLVKDIHQDEDATFQVTDNHYIFTTKTNYQSNNNLPYQEIYVNKKNYTPVLVKVLDKDNTAVVEVSFDEFKLNPSFEEKDFVLKENMDKRVAGVSGSTKENESEQVLSVMFPAYTAGANLKEEKELELENGKRLILTYDGDKEFTLIQEKKAVLPTTTSVTEKQGEMIDLGHSIGAISEHMVEWVYDGTNFYLASDQLTKDEMIEVAKSVTQTNVK